jgi:hypothetical protein
MGRKVEFSVRLSEPWAGVAPFFECYPERLQALLERVTERSGVMLFDTLNVRTLLQLIAGNVPDELRPQRETVTVKEWCGILNTLSDGLKAFTKFMEETQPPQTPSQKKLGKGMKPGNMEEAVLWTLKNCYTLHGLEDAQKLTIYEYKIARKSQFNDAVVAYNQSVASEFAANRGR